MAISAHEASWHVASLGSNSFTLLQSGQHPFSVLLQVHNSSFHHVVPSNVKPCNGFVFYHSSSLPAIIILCTCQLNNYMPRNCICANPTIQFSMHQIFTHMYLTVSTGLSYLESLTGFLKAPPPQTVFPTFHHRTSSFCCLPNISSLELSKKLKSIFITFPPKK